MRPCTKDDSVFSLDQDRKEYFQIFILANWRVCYFLKSSVMLVAFRLRINIMKGCVVKKFLTSSNRFYSNTDSWTKLQGNTRL